MIFLTTWKGVTSMTQAKKPYKRQTFKEVSQEAYAFGYALGRDEAKKEWEEEKKNLDALFKVAAYQVERPSLRGALRFKLRRLREYFGGDKT